MATYPFPLASGFTTSRTQSMKACTAALRVRFFKVTMASGHGRVGNSTGKTFSANRAALNRPAESGSGATNRPVASNSKRNPMVVGGLDAATQPDTIRSIARDKFRVRIVDRS